MSRHNGTPTQMSPRQQAHRYLCELMRQRGRLSLLLTAQDAALTKELCFGVCRYYFGLESVLLQCVAKKPKQTEVWVALLLGLYQLSFLSKPSFATVKETVALLEHSALRHAKGLVNAVLRRLNREFTQEQLEKMVKDGSKKASGSALTTLFQKDWPEEAANIVNAQLQHPPMILRLNPHKVSMSGYLKQLNEVGIEARQHDFVASAIILNKGISIEKLPGFGAGMVSVQDVSAQLAPSLLKMESGLSVLDACAAPGGKTGHLLEMAQVARCVAVDKDPIRLQRIHDNLNRLNLSAQVLLGDASAPETWWDGKAFDRILLDAPCSATGVIRRHPDILLLRSLEEITTIVGIQNRLLRALWPLLAPGGKLLYVTCSILSQENDAQIETFLQENPNAKMDEIALPWGRKTAVGWQLLPGESAGDGFYYAVLNKQNTSPDLDCSK